MEKRKVTDWVLVDTDILIDVGRGEKNAIAYLENTEQNATLSISAVTQMELMVGCENKKELKAVEQFINRFDVVSLSERITRIAVELLRTYRLSHGLLIADALIAATAIAWGIPLVSKNQKDYRFIEELELLPYPPTA